MTEHEPSTETAEPDATRERLIAKIAQIAWGDDKLFAVTEKGTVLYTREEEGKDFGGKWYFVDRPEVGVNVFFQNGEPVLPPSPQPSSEQ